jgi:hypothetical protein
MRVDNVYCNTRPWLIEGCEIPDPVYVSVGGGGTGPTRSGPAPTDVFYAKARLAELDGLIAQATSPENLFPNKRYIRALLAEKKKLLKKLSGFAKRGMYGMGEVSGLSTVGWIVAGFLVYKYFIKGR